MEERVKTARLTGLPFTDSSDKDQTAQKVQSDHGSALPIRR